MNRTDYDLHTAIEFICSVDAEIEAITALLSSHSKKQDDNLKRLCDVEASLRIISKINKARYHDEAIDALVD